MTPSTAASTTSPTSSSTSAWTLHLSDALHTLNHLPLWPVLLLARISIATVFWTSGQTKIAGLVLDPLNLHAEWGWPHLADGTVDLFRDEYHLPLIPPLWAALAAATAEHVLSLMLALGLGTRLAAAGLLGMTAVIQTLVYPGAWPTHGSWAALLMLLILRGPGPVSVDHFLKR